MEFIFFCSQVGKTFDSADFELVDNQGVKTDAAGNRYLDAQVVLTVPCPYCGQLHRYQATELPCPF